VTRGANISPKRFKLNFMAHFICVIVMAMFLYGQALAASHAHEHEHPEHDPIHNSCEVCVLAVQDESGFDITIDDYHLSDGPPILGQLERLSPSATDASLTEQATLRPANPPPEPCRQSCAARAPPSYI